MSHSQNTLVIFKGGTAFNSVLRTFQRHFPDAVYVVPVTDNGGSSREISRVFDGPSIGDLRSTLTRLADENFMEAAAVKRLMEHRLSVYDQSSALNEWHQLLEGNHQLHRSLSTKHKELILYFLRLFESERLHRSASKFNLCNGSIGNFFFSGARLAFGSLESAIFLYASVVHISAPTQVLPIIDCNESLGICAELENGEILVGQHEISHPGEDGIVNKDYYSSLTSPIKSLFYIDKYQNIIHPKPNGEVLKKLHGSRGIVYGMGSFWTSIIPSLILEGMGEAIARHEGPKIAILNSCSDRETEGMDAKDYIMHLTGSLNRHGSLAFEASCYVTHLCIVEDCSIAVDLEWMEKKGIRILRIAKDKEGILIIQGQDTPIYCVDDLIHSLSEVFSESVLAPLV